MLCDVIDDLTSTHADIASLQTEVWTLKARLRDVEPALGHSQDARVRLNRENEELREELAQLRAEQPVDYDQEVTHQWTPTVDLTMRSWDGETVVYEVRRNAD